MRLAQASVDGSRQIVVEHDGRFHRAPRAVRHLTIDELLRSWPAASAALRHVELGEELADDPVLDLPAVERPGKLLAAGANFTDHMAEMKLPPPPEGAQPYLFLKPASAIVGDGATVLTDLGPEVNLDFEAELGVVIGVRASRIEPGEASAHIAGYIVADDVSARRPFRVATPLGPAFAFDWLAHKGQDGFCPIGPYLLPAWELGEEPLAVRTTVNGRLRQDGTTADLHFSVVELVAFASRLTTLEPGDVILTGTPAGVGAGDGAFLASGDTVTVSVEKVGSVTTTFRRRQA
ncbi:fumarylacetoacetate hydrolase family protein [Herbiconiux sp. VKM Ac-1786]|uniref:fumarylacetoacetate hydrolase family protein n=1 Tax=Herbiconiux sp. VKM Ac-1786 TaxID=2783824 RepID=UPI00188B3D4B|nr:fumarylacetoacetate hydrolase family protein [Herbiconiux sp. VKM Ac-1786]MBF4571862.1 fumarylacetoacetate hydrolase family protein [Herbiconiux sp. VKM Ac-1786]